MNTEFSQALNFESPQYIPVLTLVISLSPYFKSAVFKQVFLRVGEHPGLFTLKQVEGKLKIVSRGVDSIPAALSVLKKLQ